MAAKRFLYAQSLGALTPRPRRSAQAYGERSVAVKRALGAGASGTREVAAAREALYRARSAAAASSAAVPQRLGWPPAGKTQTARRIAG
jgi:hypothetical protein